MGQTYHAIVYKPSTWQKLSDEGCKWLASLEELSFPASTCMCMNRKLGPLNNMNNLDACMHFRFR